LGASDSIGNGFDDLFEEEALFPSGSCPHAESSVFAVGEPSPIALPACFDDPRIMGLR
jgi:hypothetical protein